MARNRKRESVVIRFGAVLQVVMFFLFVGGAGLGYVWQKKQIRQLGYLRQQKEQELKQLNETLWGLNSTRQKLMSSRHLQEAIRKYQLNLVPPRPEDVITITNVRRAPVTSPGKDGRLAHRQLEPSPVVSPRPGRQIRRQP